MLPPKFVPRLKEIRVKYQQPTGELVSPVFRNLRSYLGTLVGLSLLDGFALWFIYNLLADGVWFLGIAVFLVTLGINIIFLRKDLYPLRWISPGLALILLLAFYPILFSVYSAFTNYSDGHLLTKEQSINRITQDYYLPEDTETFSWELYRSENGSFALLLTGENGDRYWAKPDQPLEVLPGQESPETYDGFVHVSRAESIKYLTEIEPIAFGVGEEGVRVKSLSSAAQLQKRFVYNPDIDAIIDQKQEIVYYADGDLGSFLSDTGTELFPGYQVAVGLDNFTRLIKSPALSGPFLQVFLWTIVFAFISVVSTFMLGLFLALVLDSPGIPLPKVIRSLLILPYAVPGVILILIWRGLLNPHLGVVNLTLMQWFGWAPAWFSDPFWTKMGILLVNLYLGYPYMMLICSGALKAIPQDVYEAAEVDGANIFQKFFNITLPYLLISVGPLLVSSFSFNFNNFNVIYLFNEGGPPIPNTPTPAGHSDILISYTYRLAFAGERGADYGYAAAIAFVIFIILSLITLFNFRFTRMWEEVSENV